jgi:hypothetical protein
MLGMARKKYQGEPSKALLLQGMQEGNREAEKQRKTTAIPLRE